MSGERHRVEPLGDEAASPKILVESRFIPQRYEPNYAYPLLVVFHGRGGDENQLVRSIPAMSWRNYVGLGLRGPELVERGSRIIGHGWGDNFSKPRTGPGRAWQSEGGDVASRFRAYVEGQAHGDLDLIEPGVFQAVRGLRKSLHVHSERVFLMGVGEGAAVALRLGMCYPERFAGVVSLNGWLPGGVFGAPVQLSSCRDLRVLVVHGEWNSRVRIEDAKRDVATLKAAGLKVAFQSYPCAHRLTRPMLNDVDSWLIRQCTGEPSDSGSSDGPTA